MIYVSFQYNFNTGTASVAAPFLFRESYGQSYVYDEDGNVVSSTDKAETEASFAYKDDTLTSSLSPTGTRYMYAKSDTTQNTTYAVSNSGQRIGFVYNGSGDATQMFINDLEFIPSLIKENTDPDADPEQVPNIDDYIMNAKDGRVLKAHSLTDDSKAYCSNMYFDQNASKWTMKYLSNNTYYFQNKGTATLGLSMTDDSVGMGVKTITQSSNYVPHAEFKFQFVANGDGSFHILTASSNLTKALYETENVHYEGSSSYSVKSKEYDEDDPAFKWYLNLLHSS